MSSFTPGPWEVVAPDKHHGWYVEDGLGRTVCDLYYLNAKTEAVIDHDPGTYGETAANARLLGAAPELLEALSDARIFIQDSLTNGHLSGGDVGNLMGARDVIDRAISKATGDAK